jgi:hypothetical protein
MGLSCDKAQSLDLAAFAVDPRGAEFDEFRAHYATCADCSREVERLSRLESALRVQATTSGHPEAEALLALERHPETLVPEQREALAAHLEGCAPCRAELRALRGFHTAAAREGHSPGGQAGSPARGAPPPPLRTRRGGLLAAALAAALLLGIALPLYLLRDAEPAEQPIAVVEPEPEALVQQEPEPAPPEPRAIVAPEPPPKPEPAQIAETPIEPAPPVTPLEPPSPEPIEVAMVFPADPLVYAPPRGVDPLITRWRVPGVVRSSTGPGVKIQALAPDHTGLTAQASPTLYWALSAATDLRVELVVTDEASEEPLLDRALEGAEAGVHALRLAELGVVLAPGTTYRWYATVVPDPDDRSSEVVSGGAIERVELDPALVEQLTEAGPGRRAHVLAEGGLFYDALDVVSTWMTDHPEAIEPLRDRAALLEAVGLGKALPSEDDPSGTG